MKAKDAITELEETNLYAQLLSLNTVYAENIKIFIKGIEPLLGSIQNYFPFYTRHDVHHGYQVVRRIEQCLNDSCFDVTKPEALTAQEIFLLIAAAYAHDLGMAVFPEEELILKEQLGLLSNEDWQTSEVLQDYLRKRHSIRGGTYIDKNAEPLGVPRNLVSALDLLMKSHNYSIPQLEEKINLPFAAGQKESELVQLAVIVCVADALEFSDTRVMDGVLEKLAMEKNPTARISYAENMKHVCTGDSLAITQDGRIIVSGTFSDENILALAHRTFDQTEEWIQGYCDIEHRARHKRLNVRGEPFLRNLAFSHGEFHRLGVRLNKRNVIDLIASNAVWHRDQGIALRELVQNSVEACRYRQHHSAPSDNYCPEVQIILDRGTHSITVSDNGCGMSERTVLNNLLTVGNSRSSEAAYAESEYAPIARFGIGFWSVFTISEVATVSTAAFENYRGRQREALHAQGFNFNIQLTELKDFTVFSPIERACGTSISLKLKPEVIIDEVYLALKKHILCSIIPVTIKLDSTEEIIESDPPNITPEILHGVRRQKAASIGIDVFQFKGKTQNTSLSLGLLYRKKDGRATFTAAQNTPMASVMEGHGIHSQRSSVCGFTVPVRVSPLCIDLLRVGSYHANSITPKGFEFSLDRQKLNDNHALEIFSDDIRNLVHDGYREFLKSTNSYHPEAIYSLQAEAASNGGNVYDTFTDSELAIAYESYPDLLCSKLIPVDSAYEFSDVTPRYLNITELSKTDGIVYCMQTQRKMLSYSPRPYIDIESASFLNVVYEIVKNNLINIHDGLSVYLMPPDRNFSMIFDNDATASASVLPLGDQFELCLLKARLGNINYKDAPRDVVSKIQGQWSGTIYWREFTTPDNKPYLLLGRHRVLIHPKTSLYSYVKQLTDEKKYAQATKTIHLLQEDEAGHKPDMLKEFL